MENKCMSNFKSEFLIPDIRMAEKKNEGFQSGAGLIRYFEEEEIKGPALDPKLVIYIAVALAVVVELIKVFWPI